MQSERREKIRTLIQTWPNGTLATQSWLSKKGVYKQLSHHFAKSGWLESVGQGAFKKAGDKTSWEGGVFALQQGEFSSVHVGGLTALELLGQSHFIPLGQSTVQLFNTHSFRSKRLLPKWLLTYFSDVEFMFCRGRLFTQNLGIQMHDCHHFTISASSSERAILEALSLVPAHLSLDHAFLLVENKYNLRVELLQELLEHCLSQKTKRLFLYLAKRCDLPCYSQLNLKQIDLGTGIRRIGKGREYDSEFKLYLPKITTDDRNIEVQF